MESLPVLRQSLRQLLELLQSNAALSRKNEDGGTDEAQKSKANVAANAVFGIPEILAQIFLFTLSSELYVTIIPDVAPLNISQVCRFWRTVAVGFPPLWKGFTITFGGGRHSESKIKLFSILLERAGNLPLSAKLIFGASRGARFSEKTINAANLALRTIAQNNFRPLSNIYLILPPECCWFIRELLDAQPPQNLRSLAIDVFGNYEEQRTLQDFSLQSLVRHPRMESLILLNHTISFPDEGIQSSALNQLVLVYDFLPGCEAGERTRLNSHHCLSALRCFPSLGSLCISLHWSAVPVATNSQISSLCSPVSHDKLRKLCIIAGDSYGELDAFLGFLNLSCLCSFELRSRATAVLSGGFQRFMGHSSTLEDVALLGRNTPADVILDSLAILPNLKRLTLVQLPHIVSFLEALSYQSAGYIERTAKRRICSDLESLTIEDLPGNSIPSEVLSHFIRSRRWFEDRTIRGALKINHPSGLKVLRVPAPQTEDLVRMEGIRDCVENGLKIERYEEEHVGFSLLQLVCLYSCRRPQTPAYLSGKDFFHL